MDLNAKANDLLRTYGISGVTVETAWGDLEQAIATVALDAAASDSDEHLTTLAVLGGNLRRLREFAVTGAAA